MACGRSFGGVTAMEMDGGGLAAAEFDGDDLTAADFDGLEMEQLVQVEVGSCIKVITVVQGRPNIAGLGRKNSPP